MENFTTPFAFTKKAFALGTLLNAPWPPLRTPDLFQACGKELDSNIVKPPSMQTLTIFPKVLL